MSELTYRPGIFGRPGAGVEHLGVVGDTYTLLLTGEQTAGQFYLIDMQVPPGGGPPPHRHVRMQVSPLRPR